MCVLIAQRQAGSKKKKGFLISTINKQHFFFNSAAERGKKLPKHQHLCISINHRTLALPVNLTAVSLGKNVPLAFPVAEVDKPIGKPFTTNEFSIVRRLQTEAQLIVHDACCARLSMSIAIIFPSFTVFLMSALITM